jgi:hypothetical protein
MLLLIVVTVRGGPFLTRLTLIVTRKVDEVVHAFGRSSWHFDDV